MEIKRHAPIVLRHEIDVFAPPEKVWMWIAQVEFWSEWHPDIGTAYLTDDEPNEIGWQASHLFPSHRQVFRLRGDYRQTALTSEASYEGRIAEMMSERLREPLDQFGQTWLAALKTRNESAP